MPPPSLAIEAEPLFPALPPPERLRAACGASAAS